MKFALVGLGNIARRWMEVLKQAPDVEIAALIDPLVGTPQESSWLAAHRDIPQLQTLDALSDRQVDAMIIAAGSLVHVELIQRGLELGLHVLVEKPFATQISDAERLVALAREKGRILMVDQNYRFFPGSQALRKIAKTDELGAVRAVIGQFWNEWPGRAYQHHMAHPFGLEMAVHHFDLVRAVFDANAIDGRVREWNPKRSRYRTGGALEALFTMAGPNGTFPFNYSGSLVTQRAKTPWGGLWRFEFDGGTIIADRIDGDYGLFLLSDGQYKLLTPFADESMAFDKSFAHFHDCIKNGQVPWCSGADNLNTLRMILSFVVE